MLTKTPHTLFWNVERCWLAVCHELPNNIMQHHNTLKTQTALWQKPQIFHRIQTFLCTEFKKFTTLFPPWSKFSLAP